VTDDRQTTDHATKKCVGIGGIASCFLRARRRTLMRDGVSFHPTAAGASDDDDDDDDESMKLVFAHSYSIKTVTSVLMKICSGKQFSF